MSKRRPVAKVLVFVVIFMVLISNFTFQTLVAASEGRSAEASYSVVKWGSMYTYTFQVKNTSSDANDNIYGILAGYWYNVPVEPPLPLQNVILGTCPEGWYAYEGGGDYYQGYSMAFGTNWEGSVEASHYIKPGETATFTFAATNEPPAELKFGVCYYNNETGWGGTGFNGIAVLTGVTDIGEQKLIGLTADPVKLSVDIGGIVNFPRIMEVYENNISIDVTRFCSWKSQNRDVVKFEEGALIPVNKGQTVITASYGSKKVKIHIKVNPVLTNILIRDPEITLVKGKSAKIKLFAQYSDGSIKAINEDIQWSSGDLNIATVNNGKINAVSEGETQITATYLYYSADVHVRVVSTPQKVKSK